MGHPTTFGERARATRDAAARARAKAAVLVESAAALQGQARQLAVQRRRLERRRWDVGEVTDELATALSGALAEQRDRFAYRVDADVLQFACAARQDLLEIHEAHPTDALAAALQHVTESIDALRALVEEEATVDAELVERAAVRVRIVLARP